MIDKTARVQVYTLSDIQNWKSFALRSPEQYWGKYSSTLYDFENWIPITVISFMTAVEKIEKKGRPVSFGHENPFFINGGDPFISPRRSLLYLFQDSLITVHPKPEGRIRQPESRSFVNSHLAEHINLALFSKTRKSLEEVSKELGLPLAVRKSQ